MFRGLYLVFIRLHILHHATHESIYGLAMIEVLRRHGHNLSPGTLYPILREMEHAGYLQREDRIIQGKTRKYYTAKASGTQALMDARTRLKELASEVIDGSGAAIPTISTIEE